MIEIKYRDRFGNRIFQYCLGRILADIHNCNLQCEPLSYFSNAIPILNKKIISQPKINLRGHHIDYNSVIKMPANYNLFGWFQRYEYYKNHKLNIKKWLQISDNIDIKLLNISENDFIFHIRLMDMDNINRCYISRVLLEYKITGKKYIVTDDPNNKIITDLILNHNFILYNKSEIEDFTFIKGFNNIVLGCSTFSWWAAFLSKATTIIFPKTGYFNVARTNFFVDDEPRYKILSVIHHNGVLLGS